MLQLILHWNPNNKFIDNIDPPPSIQRTSPDGMEQRKLDEQQQQKSFDSSQLDEFGGISTRVEVDTASQATISSSDTGKRSYLSPLFPGFTSPGRGQL